MHRLSIILDSFFMIQIYPPELIYNPIVDKLFVLSYNLLTDTAFVSLLSILHINNTL